MSSRTESDLEIEAYVRAAAGGDELAWQELWARLTPRLTGLLRKPSFIGRLARADDDVRDVIVTIMARLRDKQFQRLRLFLEAQQNDPGLTFMRWLMVVAKRVAIDCLRAHPDYVDRRRSASATDEAPGFWIETERALSDDSSGARPAMTNRVMARQILQHADTLLSETQRRAVEMWAENRGAEEIARALSLPTTADAERLVRAAVERLRRHFRNGTAP